MNIMQQIQSALKKESPDTVLKKGRELEEARSYKEAFDLYDQYLSRNKDSVDVYKQAADLLNRHSVPKITLQDFAESYNALPLKNAFVQRIQELQLAGDRESACEHARVLSALDPENGEYPVMTGMICLGMGQYGTALKEFEEGLRRTPDNAYCRSYFLLSIYQARLTSFNENIKHWLGIFLKEPQTVNVSVLARVWLNILTKDPAFAEIIEGSKLKEYDEFKKWLSALPAESAEKLADDFLLDGVKSCVIADLDIERLLTNLRREFLEWAIDNAETPESASPVAAAIAKQSFNNEYAFTLTPEEQKDLEKLEERLQKESSLSAFPVAVFSCYKAMNTLPVKKIPDEEVERITDAYKQQVLEPAYERELRQTIKSLSEITDETSQKVREQYEDNPYPRWITVSTVADQAESLIPAGLTPLSPYNILVAGCATGRYPITVSLHYPFSKITGVDLSLSSIAYGKRKAEEMNMLDNIEFVHGDILDLDKMNQTFDIIFSIGVLHHMQNPEAGWQSITRRLKPGGFMKIGLYSALERKHITEGRKYIAEHNIPDTPEGIRQMREIIKETPEDHELKKILFFNDFYSISMMRDLLFHAHEDPFTILRIKKDIEDLGLEFAGFSTLGAQTIRQYREMFPDETTLLDLDNWSAYEEKYPDTFTGMYQFWCRKP